ncbi:MAG TPA: YceI family protein [Polyangiaceae bacterium]
MKARSRFAIITTAIAALSLSALASAEMKSAGGGGLEFKLPGGTAGLTIEGKSEQLTASESGGKIVVVAKFDCGETSCLKTGIDKRDEHLWKHMESGKYKTATLTVDKSSLKLPADNDKSEGDASGELDFHGVKKTVKFHYEAKRTGSDYHIHGSTSINLGDFKIEQPSFAGVHTGMTAEVKVKFKLRE